MKGWVKIHRSILKSGTFKKLNLLQQLIALYIIINANHEDGVWHDKYKNISVPVKRGEQVVSIDKIIGWFDDDKEVTIAKVRKTLEKLITNGFITTRTTNNYTVINVVNYGVYQDKEEENNKQDNKEITKGKQRDDKGITTNKNDKNDKNDKNEDIKEIVVAKATTKLSVYDSFKFDDYNFSEEVLNSIQDYYKHRQTTKHKMSEVSLKRLCNKLKREFNCEKDILNAIDTSIVKDYRDVFPPNEKNNKTKQDSLSSLRKKMLGEQNIIDVTPSQTLIDIGGSYE